MEEEGVKRGVTIVLLESVRKELVQASLERGVTVAGLIRMLVYDYLAEWRAKKGAKEAA